MGKRLSGKVVLVTGASKGLGAEMARQLAASGASVVVNYASSREGAERVVQDIVSAGGQALAVQGNVADPADIRKVLEATRAAYGRLDVLVNNAGLYAPQPVGQITAEEFHRHFNLNVLAVILASQEAVHYFPSEGGVIINVSSVVAELCPPGTTVYNASKAAVDAVTRTFSRELAGRNIRVNSINPGLIATEGTHASGFVQDGQEEIPGFGKIGRPGHIAGAVVFLASSEAEWMHGRTLTLTGGL
jgi:3-oxoacyl-[acyl-carrier protein] reductase